MALKQLSRSSMAPKAKPLGGSGYARRGCVLEPTDAAHRTLRAVESYNLIGRDPSCQLRIEERTVSTTHSCIRWDGEAWKVQDLGSTNGTFCNGRRLARAEQATLCLNDLVSFGGPGAYRVTGIGRPAAVALPLHGGAPKYEEHGMIALPSLLQPEATLLVAENGWVIETLEGRGPATDGQVLVTAAGAWRFHCPRIASPTERLDTKGSAHSVNEVRLTFRVSSDEEHVDLIIERAEGSRTLRNRACFYLLLTLARLRLADEQARVGKGTAGWVEVGALQNMLGVSEQLLNINIYRLRRLFARVGFFDAVNIIERRSRPGKLRIGTAQLNVERT